jgi:hypothetical protein
MADRRPLTFLSLAMVCAGVCFANPQAGSWGPSSLMAQTQSLPPQIVNAQSALTAQQISAVETYVRASMAQVLSNNPADLSRGRKALQTQFGGGSSPAFILDYSKVIIDEMQKTRALDPQQPLSLRLNAMIIMSTCIDSRMTQIIDQAIKDADPAVRYWAVVAADRFLNEALTNPDFNKIATLVPKASQETLLKALRSSVVASGSPEIADQALLAISKLTIPEAREVLLQRLNERVLQHARTPKPNVSPDHRALSSLVVRLVTPTTAAQPTPAELTELVRLTYREMILCLEILEKRGLTPQEQIPVMNLLVLSEKWLKWSFENATKQTNITPVPNFNSLLALQEWGKIRLALIDFRDQNLIKDKMNLKPDDVESALIK